MSLLTIKISQLPLRSAIGLTDLFVVGYGGGVSTGAVAGQAIANLATVGSSVPTEIQLRDRVTGEIVTFVVDDGVFGKP